MILTEHGIYTKERRIEIYSADWIHHVENDDLVVDDEPPYFRQFWNRHFEVMGGCCYAQADHIFTLFGQNRQAQVADGADPAKIAIIPNGVNVAALTAAGIIGPIVPQLAVSPVVIGFAIASGALFAVQVNSNFFWMFKALMGLSTKGALKTLTMVTSIAALVSLPMVIAMSVIL